MSITIRRMFSNISPNCFGSFLLFCVLNESQSSSNFLIVNHFHFCRDF